MIKYAMVLLLSMGMLQAQGPSGEARNRVQVGDELQIGRPAEIVYRNIDFPAPDDIIRKGGSANFKAVEGVKVVVVSVKELKDGSIKIRMKPIDGSRFFGTHLYVTADLDAALSSGELQG